MVEVHAEVVGGPVLLAGDMVQVCVTLTAPALDPALSAQSSEVCQVVAWGSARVHCVCTINELQVNLSHTNPGPVEELAVTNAATSFAPWSGERGHLVLATKPKILFCDLQLLPGQSRSFLYREVVPADAPPSHRGQQVKYAYKVIVGTQILGSSINQLRLPIRVIVLPGLSDACMYSESEELAPSNPFLHTPHRDTPRHTALQMIQNISARKNLSHYNITNVRGHVVRFTIYKTSFRLGEDILATFDFTAAKVPCVQYSVTLQSEEEVSESCRQRPNQKPGLVSYTKTHEVCLSLSHTHLLLPVPLHLTPTFSTDLVSLRWQLHFEFVLSIGKHDKSNTTTPIEDSTSNKIIKENSPPKLAVPWTAPTRLNIETLVWDLPIKIYPSDPNQLSQAHHMSSSHSYRSSSINS